jgi:ABC-type transport system substrate-binding protein
MVKVFHVPEEATRLAQLSTGQIDVSIVSLVNVDQVKDMPGVKLYTGLGGGRSFTVVPAGQYYMTTDREGNALDLSGGKRELHADLPWVGDPSVPGSMENARKVRWAMAMAIDRDLIAETILAGQGCAQYSIYFPDCHPRHEERWRFDYDPEKAKMYLAEAGYPDGFEFKYAVVQGFPAEYDHISEALIPMWRAIGLEPKVDKTNFTDLLDAMQARTLNDLVWIGPYGGYSETIGIAVDNIDFLTDSSVYGTFEYQETRDFWDQAVAKLDQDEAWKVISEFQTWANEQMIMIPTVGWTSPWAAGPRVKDWDLWKMGSFFPSRLEYIVPAD